jgi:anti-sigma regulatory factor (Ser/Thr protein kinase)
MLAAQFPDPDRVAAGIWELLSNAIEHGNLDIDSDEKCRLLLSGTYHDEIDARLDVAPYAYRVAVVEFRRRKKRIWLRVTDEGKGFDFAKYLKAEINLDKPNGRGIAIAKVMAFDQVRYRGRGNVVEAWIRL